MKWNRSSVGWKRCLYKHYNNGIRQNFGESILSVHQFHWDRICECASTSESIDQNRERILSAVRSRIWIRGNTVFILDDGVLPLSVEVHLWIWDGRGISACHEHHCLQIFEDMLGINSNLFPLLQGNTTVAIQRVRFSLFLMSKNLQEFFQAGFYSPQIMIA